ncbi:restriction endonuclease subunit S [Candidatus Daviesbacteria bacterium]|nr:restriction endonuclease subunit S [Candidatus Daviesbacteria bacterium]
MKNNWQTKKIGDVAKICLGLTHTPKYVQEGVPFLSVKDISQGKINFDNTRFISRKEFDSMPDGAKPKKDDVLFCRVGTIGNPQIINENKEFGIFVSLGFFRMNKEILLNRYIAYWMMSPLFDQQVKENVQGSTLKNLNTGWLKNFDILLPPIYEQKRIVQILDEVFERIEEAKENTEKNLQNSHELFESYLQNIFANPGKEWKEKTLKEVSNYFGRGKSKHRPRNDKKLYGGQYPFIQTGDIRNSNHFIDKYSQSYNEVGLAQSKLWPKGTICITIAANIAETGILNFNACFPDSIIGIVVNPKITEVNFVEYLLQSFKTRLKAKGKGSTQDNINLATFENQLFPFPPLFEQKVIVKKLDELSEQTKKLEEIYKQKLANLEELKKSILSNAFAGEL